MTPEQANAVRALSAGIKQMATALEQLADACQRAGSDVPPKPGPTPATAAYSAFLRSFREPS